MDIVFAAFAGMVAGVAASYFLWSEAVFRVRRENRRMKQVIARLLKSKDEPMLERLVVASVSGMSATECHRNIEYLSFRSVDIAEAVMGEMEKRK